MSFRVVFTLGLVDTPIEDEILSEIDAELIKSPSRTEEEIIAAAAEADALMTGLEPYSRRVIESLSKCRVISNYGVGVDNIDMEAATEKGICVANTPDYCIEEVSDQTMALVLGCARKLVKIDKAVRDGRWGTPELFQMRPPMFQLRGQILGLVGFGRIARGVVPKAQGFGMKVIAYDPYVPGKLAEGLGVELVELDDLLRSSDFVSLHMPLTSGTHRMFGVRALDIMKPTSFLINTGRGSVVDEQALHMALTGGSIAGAGLDVMDVEPPEPTNPLLKLDNVILGGHSGFYSESAIMELHRRPAEEVVRVLKGQWPRILVNPEVKDTFVKKWGGMAGDR